MTNFSRNIFFQTLKCHSLGFVLFALFAVTAMRYNHNNLLPSTQLSNYQN